MKHFLRLLVLVPVLAVMCAPLSCRNATPAEDSPDRAAIVDQLQVLEPNPAFITEVTAVLESAGFAVDLWQGENITVEFYRELPKRGYKLVLLRVHGGILLSMEDNGVKPLENTYIFTGETYTTTKYVSEQLTDKVSNAMISDDLPLVFAVNSKFIDESKGNFDGAVIVSMGCESYYRDDLAEAFIHKGASAYIGWNTVVTLEYTDAATIDLLGRLCTDNTTVAQAIDGTMADLGRDPYFETYLKYYPPESSNRTISELIKNDARR